MLDRVPRTINLIGHASLENENRKKEASSVTDETGTSQIAPEGSDFPERRLWFDYLSELNDRALHRRALQPTSWVLIGLLAAIMYRAVPQVPSYLEISNAV